MWRDPREFQKDAVRVTAAVAILSVLLKACEPILSSTTDKEHAIAKSMLEQADQWYNTSLQDQNIQSKNQHISFAAAYIHAARHILSDASLERITGIDVHALQNSIESMQKVSSKDMVKQCPKLKVGAITKPERPKTAWTLPLI